MKLFKTDEAFILINQVKDLLRFGESAWETIIFSNKMKVSYQTPSERKSRIIYQITPQYTHERL